MTKNRGIYVPRSMPAPERFERHVERVTECGCWLWTGPTRPHRNGDYAAFKLPGGTTVSGHRYAYNLYVGPIPEGMTLDHLCRTTLCVNPAHLQPVTQRENVRRGLAPAAENAKKTHCHRGHPLSGDNLAVEARGGRRCRACHTERSAKRYQETRDA